MATLEIQLVSTEPIHTSTGGSGAHIAVYQPLLPLGWFFLGHLARALPAGYDLDDPIVRAAAPVAVAVRSNDPLALSPVRPATKLWATPGAPGRQPIEIWTFAATTPVESYVSVGLFASVARERDGSPTSSPLWDALVAVRSDLVVPGRASRSMVWHAAGAQGGGAWGEISLWSISGQGGLVPSAGFIAARGRPERPEVLVPSPYLLLLR